MYAIGLITDQVSMDFEQALRFVREQGLEYVEIHALWDKNIEELDDGEAERAKRLVDSFGLKVSNISSTLFLQCHLGGGGGAHAPARKLSSHVPHLRNPYKEGD